MYGLGNAGIWILNGDYWNWDMKCTSKIASMSKVAVIDFILLYFMYFYRYIATCATFAVHVYKTLLDVYQDHQIGEATLAV